MAVTGEFLKTPVASDVSKDPEIQVSESGKLLSLYKRDRHTGKDSNELLSPEQVASCVQFIFAKVGPKDEDGLPTLTLAPYEAWTQGIKLDLEPYIGMNQGLKVNLLAGATGSGKTSLVHILSGGMETQSQLASETKCPVVYIVQREGQRYAFLDTAGLCDTAAAAHQDVRMQELLINSVAATIQMYHLEMVTFLMCIDATSRLPGEFCEVWPQMQLALGDERVHKMASFVITKVNGESTTEQKRLLSIEAEPLTQELVNSSLGWPVRHAGRQNLEGLMEIVEPITTEEEGVTGMHMDASAESLATKRRALQSSTRTDNASTNLLRQDFEELKARGEVFRDLARGGHGT